MRLKPAVRKRWIVNAAVTVARRPGGWSTLTREAIAKEAGCSEALVSRYLGNMTVARHAIMRVAVEAKIKEIIGQSLAAHDGYAFTKSVSLSLRRESLLAVLDR